MWTCSLWTWRKREDTERVFLVVLTQETWIYLWQAAPHKSSTRLGRMPSLTVAGQRGWMGEWRAAGRVNQYGSLRLQQLCFSVNHNVNPVKCVPGVTVSALLCPQKQNFCIRRAHSVIFFNLFCSEHCDLDQTNLFKPVVKMSKVGMTCIMSHGELLAWSRSILSKSPWSSSERSSLLSLSLKINWEVLASAGACLQGVQTKQSPSARNV